MYCPGIIYICMLVLAAYKSARYMNESEFTMSTKISENIVEQNVHPSFLFGVQTPYIIAMYFMLLKVK